MCVELNDNRYFLGRASWLSELGVEIPDQQEDVLGSAVFLAEESSYLGAIFFADTVRSQSKEIITQMKDLGFSIMMLTGDQQAEAQRIAELVSIEKVYAQLLPQAKAEHIERVDELVVMVGDGVNDALALQKAAVGIAFGSDLSQAVLGGADIAVQEGGLDTLPQLIVLAKKTDIIMRRNILVSILGGIVLALCTGIGWLSVVFVALAQLGLALLIAVQSASLLGEEAPSR